MAAFLDIDQLQKAYRARQIVWLIAGLFICILIWAGFSKLDEVGVAEGKVVPSSSVQKIQSLEGGIIRSILVSEGQNVKQGEILLVLDNTRFNSAFEETQQRLAALKQKEAKLNAQLMSVVIDNSAMDWRSAIVVSANQFDDADVDQAAYRET